MATTRRSARLNTSAPSSQEDNQALSGDEQPLTRKQMVMRLKDYGLPHTGTDEVLLSRLKALDAISQIGADQEDASQTHTDSEQESDDEVQISVPSEQQVADRACAVLLNVLSKLQKDGSGAIAVQDVCYGRDADKFLAECGMQSLENDSICV